MHKQTGGTSSARLPRALGDITVFPPSLVAQKTRFFAQIPSLCAEKLGSKARLRLRSVVPGEVREQQLGAEVGPHCFMPPAGFICYYFLGKSWLGWLGLNTALFFSFRST